MHKICITFVKNLNFKQGIKEVSIKLIWGNALIYKLCHFLGKRIFRFFCVFCFFSFLRFMLKFWLGQVNISLEPITLLKWYYSNSTKFSVFAAHTNILSYGENWNLHPKCKLGQRRTMAINVLIMILSFFSHLKRTSELDKWFTWSACISLIFQLS